jgi:hypothetical protein
VFKVRLWVDVEAGPYLVTVTKDVSQPCPPFFGLEVGPSGDMNTPGHHASFTVKEIS